MSHRTAVLGVTLLAAALGLTGRASEAAKAERKSFTDAIAGTDVKFDMVYVPGGEFLMGSPAGEAGRENNEGPQHKVKVGDLWMGKCEVTWDEFDLFWRDENVPQGRPGRGGRKLRPRTPSPGRPTPSSTRPTSTAARASRPSA